MRKNNPIPTPEHVAQRRTIILYDPDSTEVAINCVKTVGYQDAHLIPVPALDEAPIGRHTQAEALICIGEINALDLTERGIVNLRQAFEASTPTPATEVAMSACDYMLHELERLLGA